MFSFLWIVSSLRVDCTPYLPLVSSWVHSSGNRHRSKDLLVEGLLGNTLRQVLQGNLGSKMGWRQKLDFLAVGQRTDWCLSKLWSYDGTSELAHIIGFLAFSSTEWTLCWSCPQGKSDINLHERASPLCWGQFPGDRLTCELPTPNFPRVWGKWGHPADSVG